MIHQSKLIIIIVTLFFVLGLNSCSRSSEQAPIRLGINVWPGYEYLFLAEKKGYFEDEGVNIQLVETGSLDDLRRAFERGKLDGMAASVIEIVQAAANTGQAAKIFMIPDFSNGADVIIAKSPIQSIADLKGKRVGLEVASLGQFMVARALQIHNMSLDDIIIVPMSQEEMMRGMNSDQVDAIMTYPPVSVELLKNDNVISIFNSADIPGEVMDIVSLTPKIIKERPEAPKKILKAWQRALDFAIKNPTEAHQIAADREGITVNEFKEALSGIKLLSIEEQKALFANQKSIENVLAIVKEVALSEEQKSKAPKESEYIYSDALLSL